MYPIHENIKINIFCLRMLWSACLAQMHQRMSLLEEQFEMQRKIQKPLDRKVGHL